MSDAASKSDILAYLNEVKNLLTAECFVFIPRQKNLQSLAQRGMTILDAKDEIMGLGVVDYYRGPKQDFDKARPGEVWEFKKDVGGTPFYVKLKISHENGVAVLKCLSFHEDDFA